MGGSVNRPPAYSAENPQEVMAVNESLSQEMNMALEEQQNETYTNNIENNQNMDREVKFVPETDLNNQIHPKNDDQLPDSDPQDQN